MKIVDVPIDSIRPAKWRTTYVLKPDLKLLAQSMVEAGWLSPIVVRREDMTIIDGFHRWLVAQQDKDFVRTHGNKTVPVQFVEIDEVDAMVLHVRMNRARGQVMAKYLSLMIHDILSSRKYKESDFKRLFNMSDDEICVLLEGNLIKHRKVKDHEYSKAWVPIEVPAGKEIPVVEFIERPPNADR